MNIEETELPTSKQHTGRQLYEFSNHESDLSTQGRRMTVDLNLSHQEQARDMFSEVDSGNEEDDNDQEDAMSAHSFMEDTQTFELPMQREDMDDTLFQLDFEQIQHRNH